MPSNESRYRNQKAVYWAAAGYDEFGEFKRVAQGVELDVKWNLSRSKQLDPAGNVLAVDATLVVDRDIPIGSQFWQGELESWTEGTTGTGTGADTPGETDLWQAVTFNKTGDLKGRNFQRTVGLKRLSDLAATVGG